MIDDPTHLVRCEWLKQFSPADAEGLTSSFTDGWKTPIEDLDKIKSNLSESAAKIRRAVKSGIESGGAPSGGYDNPVMFLQHMIWHEGWHVGLISLALRLNGQEPQDEWEEANVWGEWRVE